MRSTIARVSGFEYVAEIERFVSPAGHYSLGFYSTWDQAKAPTDERRIAQFNLTVQGLQALRAVIDDALREEV